MSERVLRGAERWERTGLALVIAAAAALCWLAGKDHGTGVL